MKRSAAFSRRSFIGSLAAAGAAASGVVAVGSPVKPQRDRLQIGGRVLARGDAGYEEWRRGMPWQMFKPARYPELIARPRNTADIVACVRFARRNGLRLAVKSGGHHVWANFLRNDGMLLDLSPLRGLSIDAEQRLAHAGPALWGRNLIQQTLPLGLAYPVAHCATVPLGGYLLGGGFGLNGDEWGTMASFGVRGAEVVTADGDVLTVNEKSNTDLFWALRGAGNGFPGIVTRYDLQLFPAPQKVLASTYIFPGTRIAEVAALALDLAREAPPHTEILGIAAIGGNDGQGHNNVICALRVAVFATEPEQAQSILAPIARHPLVAGALMKIESTASDWESMFLDSIDASRGFGFGRYAVDNLWTESPTEVMQGIAAQLAHAPSRYSHAVIQFKIKTKLPQDAALSCIAPAYAGVYSVWRDAALDAAAPAWLRQTMAPLQRYATGHYINEIDAEARPTNIAGSFSRAAWSRLTDIRRRADPGGLFQDYFGRTAGDSRGSA